MKQTVIKQVARPFCLMRPRAVATSFVVCVCAMLTACQHDPWANEFLTKQPLERDLVGTYAVDADSQRRQITLPMSNAPFPVSSSGRIVLSSDHKAVLTRVPEYDGEKPCSLSGHGSWELGRNDRYAVVNVQVQNEDMGGGCRGQLGFQLMVFGDKPPYKLHITIGDPDSGDAVQFEKQP